MKAKPSEKNPPLDMAKAHTDFVGNELVQLSVSAGEWGTKDAGQDLSEKCTQLYRHIFSNMFPTLGTVPQLSIMLTNDEMIQDLNHHYRGKESPTNILSFPAQEMGIGHEPRLESQGVPVTLGDVVMSYETILHEAEEQGKSFEAHFTHLFVHGVLHLLGYDHETVEGADVMEKTEIELLAALNIENPYEGS